MNIQSVDRDLVLEQYSGVSAPISICYCDRMNINILLLAWMASGMAYIFYISASYNRLIYSRIWIKLSVHSI